jgi:DMSO/TMAO reductase YedYZ molybdopterin-dependent catalytic subunit
MVGKTAVIKKVRSPAASLPFVGRPRIDGPIIRQKVPENLEFPFPALADFTTPNEQFYVRSHFPVPALNAKSWRLKIEGEVNQELELALPAIVKMRSDTRMATLECAGNGRIFLNPKVDGAQWELGAVSNARWTGVPLGDLLTLAGVKPGAVEVIFEGADKGAAVEKPTPPGEIHYAHSIPLCKVDDVLLAYQMNGRPLPASHGFPLRAVVGGWYGMASVKWLSRIVVTDRPFRGYYKGADYGYWEHEHGIPIRVPITEMKVKAQIARPSLHEQVPRNSDYRVVGAAWTGDSDITVVEVSADGGKHYSPAKLLGEPVRHAWRFWEFNWRTPSAPGSCTLMARATDARGNSQPAERNPDFDNYVIFHTLPIEVEIK